jgi:phosphatidylserine/phosphatidylglycerophosphate/cardiolipin synthase-like enzyme
VSADYQVTGESAKALFTLKVYRGDGMALLAMNWKAAQPPADFVGFAIEYKEPGGNRFFVLKNRLSFVGANGKVNKEQVPTTLAPIQKFRWVHFPRNAEMPGDFTYRVTPVFMNAADELSYGDAQQAALELRRETYPGLLNVTFTRGFVSSQAFVDRYEKAGPISTLLPAQDAHPLDFVPTHPRTQDALAWMGFEARNAILEVLDQAIADQNAEVRVVAYDLSEPEVVSRLVQLGSRLKIIIDNSDDHGPGSDEDTAAQRLDAAGVQSLKRQHMGDLQHNKTIVVEGPNVQVAVCGSTNFSWRGFYVQNNNAVVIWDQQAIQAFSSAFDHYWQHDDVAGFGKTASAQEADLGLPGVTGSVSFSPHIKRNAVLTQVATDISDNVQSSVLYSLAFLAQTKGAIREAITKITEDAGIFVYGIADKRVGGINLQTPGGNVAPVRPAALKKDIPEPFKSEPDGGGGIRLHHKFVVIDFNQPTARVYLGSYNFSNAADRKNGENLLLIRDRRIAVSYAIEALRIFDHYHFRVKQQEATKAKKKLVLARPARAPGETPWWDEYYIDPQKIRDRELFA